MRRGLPLANVGAGLVGLERKTICTSFDARTIFGAGTALGDSAFAGRSICTAAKDWLCLGAGALVGLEIALSGSYMLGMPPSPAAPVLQPILNLILIAAAVSLAPWAEERFFRQQLATAWSVRLGPVWAAILVAFVFAAVQVRPFSFLPAFLLSLGLSGLRLGTNRLYPAVLAHISALMCSGFPPPGSESDPRPAVSFPEML